MRFLIPVLLILVLATPVSAEAAVQDVAGLGQAAIAAKDVLIYAVDKADTLARAIAPEAKESVRIYYEAQVKSVKAEATSDVIAAGFLLLTSLILISVFISAHVRRIEIKVQHAVCGGLAGFLLLFAIICAFGGSTKTQEPSAVARLMAPEATAMARTVEATRNLIR